MTDYTAGITEDRLRDMLCIASTEESRGILQLALEGLAARKVQAEAAAMREIVEMVLTDSTGDPCYFIDEQGRELIRKALDSTAGAALLEELEQLRKLKPVAERMAESLAEMHDDCQLASAQIGMGPSYRAREALAAYREL